MQSRLKTIDEQLCTLCLNRAMEAYCGVYAQRMRTGNMTQHFAAIHKKLKDRPFAVATPMKSYFAYMGFPPCVMLQRQDSIETMKANSLNSWRYVPGVRGDGRKQHLTRVKEGANAIMLAIGPTALTTCSPGCRQNGSTSETHSRSSSTSAPEPKPFMWPSESSTSMPTTA